MLTNAAASLVFRWSVPGSTQLGFLLAQGSEFAFVILSLPAVRSLLGEAQVSVVVAAVALSLALTPNLAELGRVLAGRMRARRAMPKSVELEPREATAPVLIVGMGAVGRTLADALTEFRIGYTGIEREQRRLSEAVADGYVAAFGDMADPRLWEPVAVSGRRMTVLTAPSFEVSSDLTPILRDSYPTLLRFAGVSNEAEAERFRTLGVRPIVGRSAPPGLDLSAAILGEFGVEPAAVADWMRRQQARAGEALAAA